MENFNNFKDQEWWTKMSTALDNFTNDDKAKMTDGQIRQYTSLKNQAFNNKANGTGIFSKTAKDKVRNMVKETLSKAVLQYDFSKNLIARFESIMEADRCTGYDYRNISACVMGKHKTVEGFIFIYEGDEHTLDIRIKEAVDSYRHKRVPVLQYDFNKNLIARFNSCKQASDKTGFSLSLISNCALGVFNRAEDFIFIYEGQEHTLDDRIKKALESYRVTRRAILQYDFNKNLIARFISGYQASRITGFLAAKIHSCASGKENRVSTFIFIFEGDEHTLDDRIKYVLSNYKNYKKAVVQLTLDNEFIAEFESASEAGRVTGALKDKISSCCTGKRKKTAGYKWMYKEDYLKMIGEK